MILTPAHAPDILDDDIDRDLACPISPALSEELDRPIDILDIDRPCIDTTVGSVPADNATFIESDKHDVYLQSRCDSSTNPDRPYSLNDMGPEADLKEPLGPCGDYVEQSHIPCIKIDNKDSFYSRNPITGSGLNGDGVGGLKPKKLKNRGLCVELYKLKMELRWARFYREVMDSLVLA